MINPKEYSMARMKFIYAIAILAGFILAGLAINLISKFISF